MKSYVLLTVLIVICCGIGTAQECQIGCQSKINTLKDEVAALNRALAQQVPYLENFNLTPAQQDPSRSPFAEQVLPNYLNVLLVQVTLDHKQTAVLLPSANPAPNPPSYTPNQAIFSSGCRNSGTSEAGEPVQPREVDKLPDACRYQSRIKKTREKGYFSPLAGFLK